MLGKVEALSKPIKQKEGNEEGITIDLDGIETWPDGLERIGENEERQRE